jgi:hypothetical protein
MFSVLLSAPVDPLASGQAVGDEPALAGAALAGGLLVDREVLAAAAVVLAERLDDTDAPVAAWLGAVEGYRPTSWWVAACGIPSPPPTA